MLTLEEAVYTFVIWTTTKALLLDHTVTGHGSGDLEKTLAYVDKSMPELEAYTLANFRIRNQRSYPISADMTLGFPYSLISQSDLDELFRDGYSNWNAFYHHYPDYPGYFTVSRIGSNLRGDQALVYVANQRQALFGRGDYVLLGKETGEWLMNDQVNVWIS